MVIRHFGYWPDFHDADLLSCKLAEKAAENQSLELVLHAFAMTNNVDAKGYFILDKHCLIRLRFNNIASLNLEGFQTDNIIFSLVIDKIEHQSRWSVVAEVVIEDRNLEFTCSQPEVVSLTPCDAKGNPL